MRFAVDWRKRLLIVLVAGFLAMIALLRFSNFKGVNVTMDGERLVYRPSSWWFAILALPAGIFLLFGILAVSYRHALSRLFGAIALLASLAVAVVMPNIMISQLTLTPEGFSHTAGFWWHPEEKIISFDSLESVQVRPQGGRNEPPSFLLECRSRDGGIVAIQKSTVLDAGLSELLARAAKRGVKVWEPSNVADTGTSHRQDTEAFFVKWLETHGHSDVIVDADGVGIENNATRLKASRYGSKQHEKGGFVVETEFTILLPSKRQITEFVAGTGKSEEEAINESLLNFMLTTFHVVYKGFINANDPHLNVKSIEINGAQRDVIMGDIMTRGTRSDKPIDFNSMRAEIQGALKDLPLGPDPHWIKIVYSQHQGKPVTVAVTLDNEGDEKLTEAVKGLHWPRTDGFYMAKQFIVIK